MAAYPGLLIGYPSRTNQRLLHLHKILHINNIHVRAGGLSVKSVTIAIVPRTTRRSLTGWHIRQRIRLFQVGMIHLWRRRRIRHRLISLLLLLLKRGHYSVVTNRKIRIARLRNRPKLLRLSVTLTLFLRIVEAPVLWRSVKRSTIIPVHFTGTTPSLHHCERYQKCLPKKPYPTTLSASSDRKFHHHARATSNKTRTELPTNKQRRPPWTAEYPRMINDPPEAGGSRPNQLNGQFMLYNPKVVLSFQKWERGPW